MQLATPLDFLVVSDHAEFLGRLRDIYHNGLQEEDAGLWDSVVNWYITRTIRNAVDAREGPPLFRRVLPQSTDPRVAASTPRDIASSPIPPDADVARSAWADIVATAEAHYQPGKFTTLLGWEWSALPVDAEYARQRMRWERIVEVTQIKGDSEAHFLLSPEDEFAGFEVYPFYIQRDAQEYVPRPGDYARSALKIGLELGARVGVNPFQFGMIGSTDSHSGLSTADENNFGGKMATDSTPETKLEQVIAGAVRGWTMSASWLAAVWAEENTRESIVDAMQRRETYATTGPRIRVRFFGGWDYGDADLEAADTAAVGYARGVPMGGELSMPGEQDAGSLAGDPDSGSPAGEPGSGSRPGHGDAPTFLVVAHKDPAGANLDRVQIVKGWLDADGTARERVFDVVWSGDREPGEDGKLPPVGSTVELETARYSNSIGVAELAAVWRDPAFDAT